MSNRYTEPSKATMAFYRWVYDPLRSRYFRKLVDSLRLHGDERVLDVGSGPGSEAEHLARALSDGGSMTCLDVSSVWLDEARRRLRGRSNVDFVLGEATDAHVPDAAYDLVLAHYVLHDMDRAALPATLAALARALRPGGRFVAVEPESHHVLGVDELRSLMGAAALDEETLKLLRSLGGGARMAIYRKAV